MKTNSLGTEYRQSSVLERCLWSGRNVYVKRYVQGGWRDTMEIIKARAAREVQLLGELAEYPAFGGRLGVVQVVRADPANAELVTEAVPGEPLQRLLMGANRNTRRANCVRALFLAGRWLRAFQTLPTDIAPAGSAQNDPDDLVEYCDLRLRTLIDLDYRWCDEPRRSRILIWLQHCLEIAPEQTGKVWCHEDYGPFNLIWDGRRLTLIDFAMCKLDYSLVDLTYLVHRLEVLKWQYPWRRWPIARWRSACLRGYGLAAENETPMYHALMARHLLCRLQSLVRRPPSSARAYWHNMWLRGRVRARLSRLLAKSS